MRMNAKALGFAAGILWGASVCFATIWILVVGSGGETLAKLGVFYIGYDVSWVGAVIGLAYGLVDGFIGGFLLALLYNGFLPKQNA